MRLGRAALLAAALAFVPPAFAAAPAGDSAAPPPAAGDAPVDAAPAAPVPDPFLADMLKTCRAAASGDPATFQRLADAGWTLAVDGDTQTPFYQAFNGETNVDGIGTVELTYSLEVYPTLTEGYCSVSVAAPLRHIGIADLKALPDLVGDYRETADGIASTWQDKAAPARTFIQADQHNADLYFILDVTTLLERPAADIPYVQPPSPDPGPDPNTDGGDGVDGPHASTTTN